MCTTVAKWVNEGWCLAKTRDPVEWMRWDDEIHLFNTPVDKYQKWIVQNPNLHEDGYYGGINDRGVAFVSTYVPVAENQISYIRRPYVRLILDAGTAEDAVEIIKAFNPRIGGNMFIADPQKCFGIEGTPREYFIEEISGAGVKTNHYLNLPDRNLGFDEIPGFEAWSKAHQVRAEELIKKVGSVKDLEALLKDRENASEKRAICTTKDEEECYTHSAFIFDTKDRTTYYAKGNPREVPFKKYSF